MKITKTSLFHKNIISTHVPGTQQTFHKYLLNWNVQLFFLQGQEADSWTAEINLSVFLQQLYLSSQPWLFPISKTCSKTFRSNQIWASSHLSCSPNISSSLFWAHGRIAHFLAPCGSMECGSMWPEVTWVTARPEYLIAKAELSGGSPALSQRLMTFKMWMFSQFHPELVMTLN